MVENNGDQGFSSTTKILSKPLFSSIESQTLPPPNTKMESCPHIHPDNDLVHSSKVEVGICQLPPLLLSLPEFFHPTPLDKTPDML